MNIVKAVGVVLTIGFLLLIFILVLREFLPTVWFIGLGLGVGIPLFLLFLIWFLDSLVILKETQMGYRVRFGKLIRFEDSGFKFVPSMFERLIIFPKTLQAIPFEAKVLTKKGVYEGEEYGAVVLTIRGNIYLRWPRDDSLRLCVENIPCEPSDIDGLSMFFGPAVMDAFRKLFSQITWREAMEKKEDFKDQAEALIRVDQSPFKRAGLQDENFWLAIEKPDLPADLRAMLSLPDKERLRTQAADEVASRRAKETVGSLVRMLAESTGMTPAEVQAKIRSSTKLSKEFRELSADLISRRMSLDSGALVDVRVDSRGGHGEILGGIIAALRTLVRDQGNTETSESSRRRQQSQQNMQPEEFHEDEYEDEDEEEEDEDEEEEV